MSEAGGAGPILWSDSPRARPETMPERLAEEIAGMFSARQAAIHLLASASVGVSGQDDGWEAEALHLHRSVRYLETPEGQEDKARVNQSLAGDLRAAGLEVTSLE